MTAVFSLASYECHMQYCGQYVFSHVRRWLQNGVVVWYVWNSGRWWISCGRKKKSLRNIYKQLQNVWASMLLVKTLTLLLHKLQVPWKPEQRSVIHSNLFIQNDQWLTDRESLQLRGVGRTILMFQRLCSMQPNRASPNCVARVVFRFPVLLLGWWKLFGMDCHFHNYSDIYK